VVAYGHFVIVVQPQQCYATTTASVMSICSVDRVRTIQCSMQLTSERFRHQWHLK